MRVRECWTFLKKYPLCSQRVKLSAESKSELWFPADGAQKERRLRISQVSTFFTLRLIFTSVSAIGVKFWPLEWLGAPTAHFGTGAAKKWAKQSVSHPIVAAWPLHSLVTKFYWLFAAPWPTDTAAVAASLRGEKNRRLALAARAGRTEN